MKTMARMTALLAVAILAVLAAGQPVYANSKRVGPGSWFVNGNLFPNTVRGQDELTGVASVTCSDTPCTVTLSMHVSTDLNPGGAEDDVTNASVGTGGSVFALPAWLPYKDRGSALVRYQIRFPSGASADGNFSLVYLR